MLTIPYYNFISRYISFSCTIERIKKKVLVHINCKTAMKNLLTSAQKVFLEHHPAGSSEHLAYLWTFQSILTTFLVWSVGKEAFIIWEETSVTGFHLFFGGGREGMHCQYKIWSLWHQLLVHIDVLTDKFWLDVIKFWLKLINSN